MTAGLPGVGIGGLFYLIAALLAPLREVLCAWRGGRSSRWTVALRHSAMALSMLAGMAAAVALIAMAVAFFAATAGPGTAGERGAPAALVVGRYSALFTVTTLVLVLVGVQLMRLTRWLTRESPHTDETHARAVRARRVAAADDIA